MARYDRIASLTPPSRERAFSTWPVLRDLERHERDGEMGRRVRLRFLALRPVRRLARQGIEGVPVDSFERQVEGVREELGHLPARDPERVRLAQFLHKVRQRTPLAVTTATLDAGEVIEAAEHYHGAEEFYLTALELADAYRLVPEQVIALRLLGRLYRKSEQWDDANRCYRRAGELALRLDDRRQWSRAMDGLGRMLRLQEKFEDAGRIYEEVLCRGVEWEDDTVIAEALGGLAVTKLEAGDPERAVEHGWAAFGRALELEQRIAILSHLGSAFTRLGLYRAAERCHAIVAARSGRLLTRTQAKLDLATLEAREGRADSARDHLRDAIGAAKKHGFSEILGRAEELLTTLERAAAGGAVTGPTPSPAGELSRRIAAEVESFDETLVPASS